MVLIRTPDGGTTSGPEKHEDWSNLSSTDPAVAQDAAEQQARAAADEIVRAEAQSPPHTEPVSQAVEQSQDKHLDKSDNQVKDGPSPAQTIAREDDPADKNLVQSASSPVTAIQEDKATGDHSHPTHFRDTNHPDVDDFVGDDDSDPPDGPPDGTIISDAEAEKAEAEMTGSDPKKPGRRNK